MGGWGVEKHYQEEVEAGGRVKEKAIFPPLSK